MLNPIYIILAIFAVIFIILLIALDKAVKAEYGYFPEPKNLSLTEQRYFVVYQSPRFGTCWKGYTCDLCDGKRVSPDSYVLGEAREIQKRICKNDSMALTFLQKVEQSEAS